LTRTTWVACRTRFLDDRHDSDELVCRIRSDASELSMALLYV
jgi:hypothetical protein